MAAMSPKVQFEDIIKRIATNGVGARYLLPVDIKDTDGPRSLKCNVL